MRMASKSCAEVRQTLARRKTAFLSRFGCGRNGLDDRRQHRVSAKSLHREWRRRDRLQRGGMSESAPASEVAPKYGYQFLTARASEPVRT
jgi:hypothetical protein